MRHKTIGQEGLVLSILLMAAMSLSGLLMPRFTPAENLGLCLPSPNLWELGKWISWGIDNFLLIAIGIGSVLLNRHYNFIKSQDPIAGATFLFMAGSNVWVTSRLGASVLLLTANFISLCILFGCYRQRNSTQEFFIVATIIALGAMIQYAFLMMIPVYIAAGFILQTMHPKEFIAFLLGLVTPFWVGIGLGLIPLGNFTMPELTNLFSYPDIKRDLLVILINVGLTMLFSLLIALNAMVKLYAGNSRILALNNIIAVMGLSSCAGIILDFNNMPAYLATFYFASAFQTANLFALWQIPRSRLLLTFIAILYAASFAATILI